MRVVKENPIRLSRQAEKLPKFCSECGHPLNRQRPRDGSSSEFPDPPPLPRNLRERNIIR